MKKCIGILSVLLLGPWFLAAGPKRVACVGDSITYGLRIIDRKDDSYPAVLQKLLGDGYEVRNFGANSATVQEQANRPYLEKKIFQESLSWEPEIVVVMMGTNDAKKQNWKGAEAYLAAMEKLISCYQALSSNPKIYVLTPPKAFSGYMGISDAHIEEEAEALRGQSAWNLIDIRPEFSHWRHGISPDGIHPNAQGAAVIAMRVAEKLQDDAK